MNWKTYVEKNNAKTFVLPPGWDSRDEIAKQLECSPEKVNEHLRPAIQSGEVEQQQFKVWNDTLKRCVLVTAYRKAQPKTENKITPAKIRELKAAGKTYAEIGQMFGNMTASAVRSRLRVR